MKIPKVDLSRSAPVMRSQSSGRAYPLSEKEMPSHDGTVSSIHRIIDFLDVEKSARYKRTRASTFCNIYAYDYARLMGAFLPRVWWMDGPLKNESFDVIRYGTTVRELNANSLYQWFKDYGTAFGWRQVESTSEAVRLANAGKCVIMVAANKKKSSSGHIVAVVPGTDEIKPLGYNNVYICPVQSQAGGVNKKYFCSNWWKTGHEKMLMFVHEPDVCPCSCH